uniref:Arrestin domain-containing protein 3-like n=1 Tax=Sinocyclocheilus rhinocerous TaxID=307959 RepID=A0A673NPL4_9TELE
MSLTVKNISVIYNPTNQSNTFTSGDFISGQVILDVAKDTQMQSLSVKIKGKAEVCWTERHGQTTVVYSDKEKYYSVERFFVMEDKTHGNDHEMLNDPSGQPYSLVVAPGRHVYPFTFQLPQHVCLSTGEGLKVWAEVQNNTSRSIKPKYCLYEKHSFFAKGKRRLHTHNLLKEEGEPIEPNSKKTVTKVLSIPPSLAISILNCRILTVEYRLRVYLDVPYASDPEIKFPVVILPPQPVSGAKNSDFGIWNQPPGSNMHPNPPHMAPLAPPLNVVGPPGQFGAPGYPGSPRVQLGASGYPGPPHVQLGASGYPGPPLGQFGAPGFPGPAGQFGPNSHRSDPSAPPPYQEYQLYPQLPDHPEKS